MPLLTSLKYLIIVAMAIGIGIMVSILIIGINKPTNLEGQSIAISDSYPSQTSLSEE